MARRLKLCVYVPVDGAEALKAALFAAGAGRQGAYAECCWQVEGDGQFRPLAGAQPALGAVGRLERVRELRIEMLVDETVAPAVVAALRRAHPYEEPAFDLTPVWDPPPAASTPAGPR